MKRYYTRYGFPSTYWEKKEKNMSSYKAELIIEELSGRKGFDDGFWLHIDDVVQDEIASAIAKIIGENYDN